MTKTATVSIWQKETEDNENAADVSVAVSAFQINFNLGEFFGRQTPQKLLSAEMDHLITEEMKYTVY